MQIRVADNGGRRPEVNDTILETNGLTKEFGGFAAVQDVALRVRRGPSTR